MNYFLLPATRRRGFALVAACAVSACAMAVISACGGSDPVSVAASPGGALESEAAVSLNYRIRPYLQQPASDGMLITWFSKQNRAGEVRITGTALNAPIVLNSTPVVRAEMAYTALEKAQVIAGLEPGSWLIDGQAFKHSVRVTGLLPDTTYRYEVTQNGELYSREFKTAPTSRDWSEIRFVAMSDSETEPAGRVTRREWAPGTGGQDRPSAAAGASGWVEKFGAVALGGVQVLRYAMTEAEGFINNLRIVDSRRPDFVLMPGDLVQGSGYQPAWDEFFRHMAGVAGDTLSRFPLIAAYGNWETFAALNDGYGTATDRSAVVLARHRFKTFIDGPDNGTAAHRGNYHRIDYGPVTIITLDSTKGAPEDTRDNYPAATKLTLRQYTGPGTDTQSSFRADQYAAAAAKLGLTNDISPYNEGTVQFNWARAELTDARAKGQVIFVQFHHAPFSDGEHGLPMNHIDSSGQGGTPMRIYHPLFEQFGVAAVFSGHSEMFERSFVDENGDGIGVQYYDVGVSGDGLRGERRTSNGFFEGAQSNRLQYNPFSRWSSDENEPERWTSVSGKPQLQDGGKHYGHLEVNIERINSSSNAARITFTPVYSFPVLDANYNLLRTERRLYTDPVTLVTNSSGRVVR
jgi:hypothetical protein